MTWNKHSEFENTHAFLSASNYHWIHYDVDKLVETYNNHKALSTGTSLHNLASMCIKLGQKLPEQQKALNMFVNDAIDYKMRSEQMLFYSRNCYGTSDAIIFRKNTLRIHDLKTGAVPAPIEQLSVYAALFCLEYKVKPKDISIELRIYQNGEIISHHPEVDEIVPIMDKIISFDKIIEKLREQVT